MKVKKFATPNWELNTLGDKACNDFNEVQKLASTSKKIKKKNLKAIKRHLEDNQQKTTLVKMFKKDVGPKTKQKNVGPKNNKNHVIPSENVSKNVINKKTEWKNNVKALSTKQLSKLSSNKKGKKPDTQQLKKTSNIKGNAIASNAKNINLKKYQNIENKNVEQYLNQNPEQVMEPVVNTNKYTNKNVKLAKLKEKIRSTLDKNGATRELTLRQRMMEKLKGARFRYLNEQIYTTESNEAVKLFKEDPEAFKAYHVGYRQQINRWPLNPLDTIIKSIKKMPKNYTIADLGCGDARLAKSVEQKVYSFDLVAIDDTVTACDMSKLPLTDNSVDVVVFCLSLMGTNLKDYLMEANRILNTNGILKIVEVESRFDTVDTFIKGVQHFGFKKLFQDLSHNLFYFIDFKKTTNIKQKNKLPSISLHPCLYKKR